MTAPAPNLTQLSIGWPLLPLPDENGRLVYPSLADSVRQRMRAILMTRPGEQLMRPEFGGGLEAYLHDPNTMMTRRRIRDAVHTSIEQWEPRIRLDAVAVDEVEDRPSHVRVESAYRLRTTGEAGRLGLTLELGA